MDDKVKFMWKGAIWIAVITTIVLAACGLIWGSIIEGSLFAEIYFGLSGTQSAN